MLKRLIYSFIILVPLLSGVAIACDKAIDPNKVMLFIDTNLSLKEVEAARKGACERGERFVLHPDGELADKGRKTYYNYLTKKEYYDKKCDESTPACDKLEAEVDKLDQQMNDFDFEEYKMNDENIKKALASVKASNASISTLVVSGHDGGGEISGDYISGSFTKNNFFNLYDEVFDAEDKKKLHSVLLWGCYTGTYSEATDWKTQFPDAKAIAGFYDSAPLATRPASSDLMLDFLVKEESLYSIEDEKELKRSIQNLKSILYVQPGIMINACHDEQIYYSHFLDGDHRKTFFLTPSDADEQCKLIQEEWPDKRQKLISYLEGYQEVPEKISGSELRSIYGFIRQNEKCFKDHLNIDANKVGLLLFWNGVSENFNAKYGDLLDQAQKEMDELAAMAEEDSANMRKASEALHEQWKIMNNGKTYWGDSNLEEMEKSVDSKKESDDVYKELYKQYSENKDFIPTAELKEKLESSWEYSYFFQNLRKIDEQKGLKVIQDKTNEVQADYAKKTEKYNSSVSFAQFSGVKLPSKKDETHSRMKLIENLRRINNAFPTESFQKVKEKYPHIEEAYKKMDQLLFQLDPSCMNFLEWHQLNPNKPLPRNQCEGK